MQLVDRYPLVTVLETNFEKAGYEWALPAGAGRMARLRTLTTALSSSPLWARMSRAVLVVRPAPDPVLGVVGYFDTADRARLEGLRWQLENAVPRLRYVGYDQAEEDCERLADRLTERFGREELLRTFRFTAIPRGGFIVLGMLAYILGLRQSQLEPPHQPERPLVVVDDCALSGLRFGRFLQSVESARVVFAHLYSPPELRHAIESQEQREVICLSAHDLQDLAPATQGEGYSAWRERWLDRMDSRGYWVGLPEPVCFAWNEPDTGIWNPVTKREESGWRLVPPDLCLKNRLAPGAEPVEVQVQLVGKGPLKPSSHVLFGELEEQLLVGDLQTGECFVLESVGADMWRAIVEYGDPDQAADALLREYEVDGPTLHVDLRAFVDDLLSRGLLVNDE